MLRKVLKHDLLALLRVWLIMSVSVFGLSILTGLACRFVSQYNLIEAKVKQILLPFVMLFIFLSIVAVFAYSIANVVFQLVRYYQNFFTDEGYLTFTLPVKRSTLFASKILTALIYNAATMINIILFIVIVLMITPENSDGSGMLLTSVWDGIGTALNSFFGENSPWSPVYVIVAIVMALLMNLGLSPIIVYACVTIGCVVVRKYKILTSIGIYYAASSVISMVSAFLNWIVSVIVACIARLTDITTDAALLLTLFFIIIACMMILIVAAAVYRFTLSRIEKNLNLA